MRNARFCAQALDETILFPELEARTPLEKTSHLSFQEFWQITLSPAAYPIFVSFIQDLQTTFKAAINTSRF